MDYVLGIDGGGTKTVCAIADSEGHLLSAGKSGPSNPLTVGELIAKKSIMKAINDAVNKSGINILRFKIACLGIAGAGNILGKTIAERIMEELNIADKIIVESDAAIALAGATAGNYGVIVIAGTGSIAFGINERGERWRAGGWGYIVGDEGSGYDIGRKAITAALRAYDGRGPKTALLYEITNHFNIISINEIIEHIYAANIGQSEIAALTPLVVKAAERGDKVAKRILDEAGKELGLAAKTVIRKLRLENEEFDLAIIGGVFKAGDLILNPFKKVVEKVAPKCRIICPKFEPVIGAIFLALKEIGVKIDTKVLNNIKSTSFRVHSILQ
ncbi:MAG: BadF/BadG/BcrA/BcrD ATPase family protein [Candidatus Bathyarchaeia archaeon]